MKSILLTWCFMALAGWTSHCLGQVVEFDLENGIHVIVNPIPQVDHVGVETFHEVGFADEPQGMVQASHLLEHLVCYAPGAGFQAKGAMEWLNKNGMANAETMIDSTHYDYGSKAPHLEKILQIESARLQQSSFDPEMIAFEAKRVYQETDFVENNPRAGMLKHAFMALFHAWRYNAETALVRGGLEDVDPDKLLNFYHATYSPRNLTIAITGNTTPVQARRLVEKHFGKLENREVAKPTSPLDWNEVSKRHTVRWDSKHRAVCIAWAPPKNHEDRITLSLLAAAINQSFLQDKELKQLTEIVFCSNNMWLVGDAPLFVYAMAKPDADLARVEKLIAEKFEDAATTKLSTFFPMVRSFGFQLEFQRNQDPWPMIDRGIKMLTNSGRDRSNATQMAILQDALNRCMSHRMMGKTPQKTIRSLKQLTEEELAKIVKTTVNTEHKHVVHIVPMD